MTAVNMVTVHCEVRDPTTQVGAVGLVRFRLPYPLRDATDHVLFANSTITVALVNGVADVQVPANDSAGVTPSGFAYTVVIDTDVMQSEFYALVPSSPSTVYLSDLVPVLIPPPVGVPGGGIVTITSPDASITVGGTSTAKTVQLASALQSDITAALDNAGTALTAAATAGNAAAAAQATANAAFVKPPLGIPSSDMTSAVQAELAAAFTAYQKPSLGIPKADLVAAVQTSLGLADTALQAVPPAPDPYAVRFGGHSCNVPLHAVNNVSTINGEVWVAIVPVKAGVSINGAFCFRTDAAAANSTTGLNGFAVYDIPAAGGAGALLGSSVSDDTMWQSTGQIDKAVAGVPTPSVDGLRAVLVSVRGYSSAPVFGFVNMAAGSAQNLAQLFGKYRGGGFTSWPSTFNLATDAASGVGFVLPVFLRA